MRRLIQWTLVPVALVVVAFGIVYLLPRMNLATYLGATLCRAGDWLEARGMVPFGLRAAFWELVRTSSSSAAFLALCRSHSSRSRAISARSTESGSI